MAFSAMSYFVFGEVVTAARINQFIDNDNALRDGTGLATNAVPAASLATSAIFLGIVTRVTDFATTSASAILVTDMELTVTVPAGSRKVMVVGGASNLGVSGGTGQVSHIIWDGAVGSGTAVGRNGWSTNGSVGATVQTRPLTVSAGAKTYRMSLDVSGGFTCTLTGTADRPIWLAAFAI